MDKITYTAHFDKKLAGLIDDNVRLYAHEAYYRLMEPYMPKATGNLIQNHSIQVDGVHFHSPYAHYLYMGKVYVDPVTRRAGFFKNGRWYSRKGVKKVQSDRELRFSREENELACAFWDKAAMLREGDKFVREVEGYIIRKANQK